MKPFLGSALILGGLGLPALVIWRIVVGVESWFATSGAGNWIMWTATAAVIIAVLGVGAGIALGAVGLGLRPYVVRVRLDERDPVSLVAVVRPARLARPAAHPQLAAEPVLGELLATPVAELAEKP